MRPLTGRVPKMIGYKVAFSLVTFWVNLWYQGFLPFVPK
jgi:hypothetical protein